MTAYLRLILVLILAFMPIQGCKQKPDAKPATPLPAIGVSIFSDGFEALAEPFKKEMQSLAKEKKLRLIWKESKTAEKQKEQFEEIIKQKPKVILAFFPEEEEAKKLAKLAKEKGILMLAFGSLAPDSPADGFIGIDPQKIGEQQGEFILENLMGNPKPKVLILTEKTQNYIKNGLAEGNRTALEKNKELQIIEKEMPTENIPLVLNEIWDELGRIDGLITHSEQNAKAVLVSLKGQPFPVISIGIGAGKELVQAIASGEHKAEVDLEPEVMARYAFEAAERLAKTGEWDFDTWVDNGHYQIPVKYSPSRIITRENLSLLQERHGKLKPVSPSEALSGKKAEDSKEGSQDKGEEQKQSSSENKIKVKLKGGKEMEFQVPDEIESIEITGKGKGEEGQENQKEAGKKEEGK